MSVTLLPANPSELVKSLRRAIDIAPADLLDNPRNLRENLGDLSDLKASIPLLGIMCPLIVVDSGTVDEQGEPVFQIIIGHRRKYAAIELGLAEVPCWIASSEDEARKVAAQLAENGHRVGLTPTEEAEGYHQLMLLDWSLEQISGVRGIGVAEVKKTLKLRELPEQARQAVDSGALTLEDSAKMAEFAEEPAALARILKASTSTWGLQHAISGERAKKAYATAKERLKAQLVLDGVKVTSKPKGFPAATEKPAVVLVGADGAQLDPEVVKTWPGFAAFIDKSGLDKAQAVVYCADPEKYGYTVARPAYSGSQASQAEQARREAEAAAEAEYLNALELAAPVRQAFYRSAYGSAKVAKRLFVDALRSAVVDEDLPLYDTWDELYAGLGGVDDEVLAGAGEDRLRRALVARWICRHEQNLAMATIDRTWDIHETAALWWLDLLVADGYVLSDAETQLQHKLAGTSAEDDRPLTGQVAPLAGPPTPVQPEDVDLHGGRTDAQAEVAAEDTALNVDLDETPAGLTTAEHAAAEITA